MGGLQVQHPAEHAGSLQLNLIQRIYHDSQNNHRRSLLPDILQDLLQRINRPTLEEHVQQLGPIQWVITGKKLKDHNHLLSQAFIFMAKFLRQYEMQADNWHVAALHGHSAGKTFIISEMERRELKEMGIFSVSQLFELQDNMQTSDRENTALFEQLDRYLSLIHI